jgi:uncharacterized protein YjbJ (UPF0337 family)/ElaB/YqjD/DUF883 family membrane-anchored ribosome-binding protein
MKGDLIMNADTFEGQWKQMRGELRSWWGKLTDDDFEKIGGKKDRLVGVLQEKYGYTRTAAQQEIDRHFKEYDERRKTSNVGKTGPTTSPTSQSLGATLGEVADEGKSVVDEATSSAGAKASQSISAVGETIGSVADTIREKAPHEGAMGTAATTVADKLGAAGSYLQEKNWDRMTGDLSSLIRRYPVPSLLLGLGIGYLLALRARR